MNNKKLNTDDYTKDLVSKVGIQQPSSSFTLDVMSKILRDPAIKLSFVSDDDKKSNIWLAISMSILVLGFLVFYFLKHGLDFSPLTNGFKNSEHLNAFSNFFSQFWSELSLSPYVLLALLGVIFLVVIDKTIVKYLYSI